MTRAPIDSQLQATLGDAYTLERELIGGGMSRVFVATERALGRKVVIKILPGEMAGALSVERFKREIGFAARLQQANIVPMLSAGDMDASICCTCAINCFSAGMVDRPGKLAFNASAVIVFMNMYRLV